MSWHWRLADADGAAVSTEETLPDFTSQSDAESWIGEVWRDLVDAGAAEVSLYEDDRLVYGPMSLSD